MCVCFYCVFLYYLWNIFVFVGKNIAQHETSSINVLILHVCCIEYPLNQVYIYLLVAEDFGRGLFTLIHWYIYIDIYIYIFVIRLFYQMLIELKEPTEQVVDLSQIYSDLLAGENRSSKMDTSPANLCTNSAHISNNSSSSNGEKTEPLFCTQDTEILSILEKLE